MRHFQFPVSGEIFSFFLVRMQRWKDQRSRSSKPTTVHGFAQSGDLTSLQKLLRENPLLLNDRNPVVRSFFFFFIFFFPFPLFIFWFTITFCVNVNKVLKCKLVLCIYCCFWKLLSFFIFLFPVFFPIGSVVL